jgi:iron complex outermembrane recepter protein
MIMTRTSLSPGFAARPETCSERSLCWTPRSWRESFGQASARHWHASRESVPRASAPTASRPILRGLSGDRIRVLTDGIGSFDVSSSSPDHAVAINPLTAERIEVLRGPAALLYGSSAIGGVVNVIDRRIPRDEPAGSFDVNGLLEYGSAANERNANLSVDGSLAPNVVLHADGNWSKSDDLRTGGYLLSRALRDQAAASPFPRSRSWPG